MIHGWKKLARLGIALPKLLPRQWLPHTRVTLRFGTTKLIRKLPVYKGAEVLLKNDFDCAKIYLAMDTLCIMTLEHYNPSKHLNGNDLFHMVNDGDFFVKHRDMFQGCERPFTRFYYKRIPCSCWWAVGCIKISVQDRNLRLLYAEERVQFSEGLQSRQEDAILL